MAKILIVDDDKNILEEFRNMLEDEGHRAEMAASGAEAIRKFQDETYDLVFLDVLMPRMEGREVLEALQQIRKVPVVMMSGFLPLQKENEIMEQGARLCLRKPLDADQVRALIQSTVSPKTM